MRLLLAFASLWLAAAFVGFDELHQHSSDGLLHWQSFAHDDEHGSLRLNYQVEQRKDVTLFDLDKSDAIAVDCSEFYGKAGRIAIKFPSAESARVLLEDTDKTVVMIGGDHYGCMQGESSRPLMHFVTDVETEELAENLEWVVVVAELSEASFTDVLWNAEVEFYSSKPLPYQSEDTKHDQEKPPVVVAGDGGDRRFLGRIVNGVKGAVRRVAARAQRVWRKTKSAARAVVAIARTALEVARFVASGGDFTRSATVPVGNWNWNANNAGRLPDATLRTMLSAASVSARLDLDLAISIRSARLQSFRIISRGRLTGSIRLEGSTNPNFLLENEVEIGRINTPKIPFALGPIPMWIQFVIPIEVGYDIDAWLPGQSGAYGSATINTEFGVRYSRGTGMESVRNIRYDADGGFTRRQQGNGVSLTVFIRPTVQLQVLSIGGPYFGVVIYVEADAWEGDEPGEYCSGDPTGINMALDVGFQVITGASIDIRLMNIELYYREWGPWCVYQSKTPLIGGCYHPRRRELEAIEMGENGRRDLSNDTTEIDFNPSDIKQPWCTVGTVWEGVLTRGTGTHPTCAMFDDLQRELSLQIVEVDTGAVGGATFLLMGGMNDQVGQNDGNVTDSDGCSSQLYISAKFNATGGLIFTLDEAEHSYCSREDGLCSCNDTITGFQNGTFAAKTRDFTSLLFEHALGCYTINISRFHNNTQGEESFAPYQAGEFDPCRQLTGVSSGVKASSSGIFLVLAVVLVMVFGA